MIPLSHKLLLENIPGLEYPRGLRLFLLQLKAVRGPASTEQIELTHPVSYRTTRLDLIGISA